MTIVALDLETFMRLTAPPPERPIMTNQQAPQADSQPAVQQGDATRAAARALSDRVAEMCNVDKEDHWKYHSDDVLSDAELVISTYLAARAPADSVTAPVNEAVAYLDIGAGGYIDLGTDLSEEALSRLPKGRHALTIAGTYGIDGYTPTTSADSVLEDAARLDWLALAGPTSICVVIDRPHDSEVEVATDDVTGYGKTLREAIDAARKQGCAT